MPPSQGRGTTVYPAVYTSPSKVRYFPGALGVIARLRALAADTKSNIVWHESPDSKKLDECSSLLLELLNKPSSVLAERLAVTEDAQQLIDFVFYDLCYGQRDDEKTARFLQLLDDLATSLTPQCAFLPCIRSSFPKMKKEANLCIKSVKSPFSARLLKGGLSELIRRRRLVHPNILPFHGIFAIEERLFCMIYPWLEWNLEEYIEDHRSPLERTPLIFDIIDGLKYLHDKNIVHGNLTCYNVLVSKGGRAALADFESYIDHIAGVRPTSTDRWKAPEVLWGDNRSTKASNFWSFGCLGYQILTGLLPYWHHQRDSKVKQAIERKQLPNGLPYNVVADTANGRVNGEKAHNEVKFIQACWMINPEERPTSWTEVRNLVVESLGSENKTARPEARDALQNTNWNNIRRSAKVSFATGQVQGDLLSMLNPFHEIECHDLIGQISKRIQHKLFDVSDSGYANMMVDFLDRALSHPGFEGDFGRLTILHSRVNAKAKRLPKSLFLEGVDYSADPLDEGGFAFVHRGSWNGENVGVKIFKVVLPKDPKRRADQEQILKYQRLFVKELTMWSHLSHPNILPLYGVIEVNGVYSPVSPWMKYGNLSEYLMDFPQDPRAPFIADILHGLAYLHAMNIVHGDLKGQNILVSSEKRAVIGDFGLSKATTATANGFTSPGESFSGRWTAPEMLKPPADGKPHRPTTFGDIWSMGCLIYEIMLHNLPYSQYDTLLQVMSAVQREEPPARDTGHDEDLWTLLLQCWKFSPLDRPSCQEVLTRFESIHPESRVASEEETKEMRIARKQRIDHMADINFYEVRRYLRSVADPLGITSP